MSKPSELKSAWFWGRYAGLGMKIVLLTFLIDQISKWWLLLGYRIQDKGRVHVAPFLDLVFVKNTGISYSMLDQSSYAWQLALAAFAAIASVALWFWLCRPDTNRLMAWSIGLIIGGAVGNALDRVLIGGVADFFSLHAFGFYWYIFNIADVAIVAGVAGLLYDSFIASRNDAVKPM